MAFKINNTQETPNEQDEPLLEHRLPILHKPKTGVPAGKVLIIIGVLIVIAVGVFLVIDLTKKKEAPSPPQEVIIPPPPVETAEPPQIKETPETIESPPPEKEVKKKTPTAAKEPTRITSPRTSEIGDYTIYVGSFRIRSNAEAEIARWNESGHSAFMVEKDAWYRVAIGKYKTRKEAQAEAERLTDLFKNGFWVDRIH